MTTFERLRTHFSLNWTTVWVGWKGTGVLSPWPDRWTEFPPLLSVGEIADYASERLMSASDPTESSLGGELLDNLDGGREAVESALHRLSDLENGDSALEMRKWRVAHLEGVLETLPKDPLYGLTALSEFWQEFGFPPDSPHVVQGRGNSLRPDEYYQQENLDRLLNDHNAWVELEIKAINSKDGRRAPSPR